MVGAGQREPHGAGRPDHSVVLLHPGVRRGRVHRHRQWHPEGHRAGGGVERAVVVANPHATGRELGPIWRVVVLQAAGLLVAAAAPGWAGWPTGRCWQPARPPLLG